MIIVVDIEMTGADMRKNSIAEIGAVVYDDPTQTFSGECRMWDGAEINDFTLEYNGFTYESLTDPAKPSEAELVKNFFEWWSKIEGPKIIAGQHIFFDLDFLSAAALRAGLKNPIDRRILDQHSLCFAKMRSLGQTIPTEGESYKINSDFLMSYVGISSEPKPHRAMNGALWEAEALSRLLEGKNKLPQFAEFAVPDYLKK